MTLPFFSGPDDQPPSLEALRRRIEFLGAARSAEIAHLARLLEHQADDILLREMLARKLDAFELQQTQNPNYLAIPPTEDDLYPGDQAPDVIVGKTTETGVDYGPRMIEDAGTQIVTGRSGGGKTTFIQNELVHLHTLYPQLAIIVFDVKGDYTCLASIAAARVIDAREELRLAIISPPGQERLEAWLPLVATYLCAYRGLRKSRHVLIDVLKRLAAYYGFDKDRSLPAPSLHNVLEYLEQIKTSRFSKDAEYLASLRNELRGLLHDSGSLFDTCDGVHLERDLLVPGSLVVLQVDRMDVPMQQFISSVLVERVIRTNQGQNIHNPGLKVLVVLDEAQLVLGEKADRETPGGIAPLAHQLLRARECGVGFLIAPHLLSEISSAVQASAKTMMVIGGLTDRTNIDLAAKMMHLPPRADVTIPRLSRGQALVREVGTDAYRDAFLVDLDAAIIDKSCIDESKRRQLITPHLTALPASPSKPLSDYPALMAELRPQTSTSSPGTGAAGKGAQATPPSSLAMDLLWDCARYRDDWFTERVARLKVGDYKVLEKGRDWLIGQDLARQHDIRLGRATYAALQVLPDGWTQLGQAAPPHYTGVGGFRHTVCAARLSKRLERDGWTQVKLEFRVGPHQHALDVGAVSPEGTRTGFEITFSHSNVISNALRSVGVPGGVDELYFLCPLNKDVTNVKRLLKQTADLQPLLPQIHVLRIDQFIS